MDTGMSMSQVQICTICGTPWSDHDPECPAAKLEYLESIALKIPCPECSNGRLGINSDDFYECRKCKCQFTGSTFKAPEEGARHYIEAGKEDLVQVVLMSEKGKGDIPHDQLIQEAISAVKKAKAELGC